MSNRVLIVDDSRLVSKILVRLCREELGIDAQVAATYAEAVGLAGSSDWTAALVDLNLPDAPAGAAVDLLTGRGFPVVVITGELSDDTQTLMWSKRVADYLVKDEQFSPAYVVAMLDRFIRNQAIEVLVVDDSRVQLKYVVELLERHRYRVLPASLPSQCLELLESHPAACLVITDFNMPEMDGCALTRRIRKLRKSEDFAIIGVSAQGSAEISARFIKSGANDFIHKPFSPDEFYCRVNQNVSMLERIRTIRESAVRDFMTGLYNRRHFYDIGKTALEESRGAGRSMALSMIDVDKFKAVNDTYGHDAGDAVLRVVASVLKEQAGRDTTAFRLGGEEFCVLFRDLSPQELESRLEHLRATLEGKSIAAGGHMLKVTASFGATRMLESSLDEMLRAADECLYEAKHTGRNKVVIAGAGL